MPDFRIVRPPPPLTVDSRLADVPDIKPAHLPKLARLQLSTVRDLLFHLPRRHDDTREAVRLAALRPGTTQTVRARVRGVQMRKVRGGSMTLVEADLEDDFGGSASAVWFNPRFRTRELSAGMELLFHGPVGLSMGHATLKNPTYETAKEGQRHVGLLTPIYPETGGITSRWLRERIEPLLPLADSIEDALPVSVRVAQGVPGIGEALRGVHFPARVEDAQRGLERIAFEELFLLQLAAQRARRRRLSGNGVVVPYDAAVAREFAASLPFTLTAGQRRAAHQVLTDMAGTGPMNRLLQGDVGSGKTVVAAMAAIMAHRAGLQVAVMAPTEILARQHHVTLERLLAPHGLAPRLLVGSTSTRARREVLDGVASGMESLIVGTHALIEDAVRLPHLGLVVVDEQHRFGVAQRQRLRRKGAALPNFLAMTATPIPRSLALTAYGDVDLSELLELPPGRQEVRTRVVPPERRGEAYGFVREQVEGGRQAFIICPLVENSEKLEVRSATAEFERLGTQVFPDLRIELLHGRLPARDKEERMARFVAGEVDILVSTSVVEVGVDVPNATVMVIEGAERFGLAQLHQFRGRVGRGEHQSFCLLFQGSPDEAGSARLDAVAATQSGFELAELDLQLRGPGEVAGLRQHGLPEMRAADLLDEAMLRRARDAAAQWLDRDPDLTAHAPLHAAMSGYRAVFDLD